MERIAFIIGDRFIYWSPIILALAALAAICVYCGVYVGKGRSLLTAAVSVALSILIGMPMARLLHWYCRSAGYASLESAMTDYTKGGYALAGIFFGCFLAALLTRLLRISRNLPKMLDSMVIGGGVGIAVGRLAALFNNSDRGMLLPEDVGFPWASPVVNGISGAVENRLATFMLQSMLTGGIVALLLLFMLVQALRRKKVPAGDVFMIFLLAYCSGQAILESTRYDSLFFRSNGFVSMVQILSLLGLLIPIVYFSIRMVKNQRLRVWHFPIWLAVAGLLGLAGYMEYYVQRHDNEALFAYRVMGSSLAMVVLLGLLIRLLSLAGRSKSCPQPAQTAQLLQEAQAVSEALQPFSEEPETQATPESVPGPTDP